jgi:hypothetical protein
MNLRHQTHSVAAPDKDRRFIVVRRVPQLSGEPEYCVVDDGFHGDAVGLFWNEMDAQAYAAWREKSVAGEKGKA